MVNARKKTVIHTGPAVGAVLGSALIQFHRVVMEPKMKVASSLKTLKSRDRNRQVVRRRGRLYVINKRNLAPEGTPGLIPRDNGLQKRSALPAVFLLWS